MADHSHNESRLSGIALTIGAVALFALLDACAKYLSQWHQTPQIVWARYIGHFAVALIFFMPRGGLAVWRSARPGLQVVRSALLLTATTLNFIALAYLQLAETSAIAFSMPLWVAVLAIPLLGERIGPRRWAAVVLGFIGVLIVIRPGSGLVHWAVFCSVLMAVVVALYQITTRQLASVDSSYTTQFYTALVGTVLVTPLAPFFWTSPSGWALVAMIAIGIFGGFGHYLLILAHRHAPAAILAPFSYTQIVWMVLLGFFLFGDVPDRWTLVGALVVICSGLYLLFRERAVKAPNPVGVRNEA